MLIFFSMVSTTLLPFYVLILGVISIKNGGIEQSVTLAVITAASAIITTWYQNSYGLTFFGTSKKLINSLIYMALALLSFLILSATLKPYLSAEFNTIFAGLIYGIGCSAFNLLNRIAAKELSALGIACYVTAVLAHVVITTSYLMGQPNFLTTSFTVTGSFLLAVSIVSFVLINKNKDGMLSHKSSHNYKRRFVFGVISSLRLNSLIILSMFYASPKVLPEITFALFVMRPLSLIFSIISPLIYKFMDQTPSIDKHKRTYFIFISLIYTILACLASYVDIFDTKLHLTEVFLASLIIIFLQVNYGIIRNLIEYRCLQSNNQILLVNGSARAIISLLIFMALLIYANMDMFIMSALLFSELTYVHYIRKRYKYY